MVVTKLVTVVSLGLIEKSLRVRLPPTILLNIALSMYFDSLLFLAFIFLYYCYSILLKHE